jgi:hypothetical protein
MSIKSFLFFGLAGLILATLGGCATSTNQRAFTSKDFAAIPPLNIESEAEVGESVVSNKTVAPAIKINNRIQNFSIEDGVLIACGVSEGSDRGIYYCPRSEEEILDENLYFAVDGSRYETAKGGRYEIDGLFVPSDKLKPVEVFQYRARASVLRLIWNVLGIARKAGVAYIYEEPGIVYKETQVGILDSKSFKRELVYSGITQNTILFRYREYKDSFARPAFTEDLKYDLSQGDIIGYKGARFQVIKADNMTIRFKVLNRLE